MKALTHQEFKEKLLRVNPNVKLVGTYVNKATKISFACNNCGKVQEALPQNLFTHSGLCKDCSKSLYKSPNTKTHDQYIDEMKKVNPNVIIIGTYVNATTKIEWECRDCGKHFFSRPNSLKSSTGLCQKCNSKISNGEYRQMAIKKNKNINIVGNYVDSTTPIEWKCSCCGKTYFSKPATLQNLSGICQQCKFEKNRDAFFQNYNKLKTPPILLSTYEGVTKKIICRCRVCGYEWQSLPNVILTYKYPCPKCSQISRRTSHQDFIEKLKKANPNITVLGEYSTNSQPVLCKCNLCGHEWTTKPNDLSNGRGCPQCNHTGTSFVEQLLLLSLKEVCGDNEVLSRDKSAINKELDIYVPSLKLAIEYGAWYWHKSRVSNDQEKILLCENKGILLICVYDSCKENDSIQSMMLKNTIVYENSLSENDTQIQDLLLRILSLVGKQAHLSYDSWSDLRNKAYLASRRSTTESFINDIATVNNSIEVIGEYYGATTPIKVRCINCGRIWDALPKELKRGTGCLHCYHERQKDSQDEFVRKLTEINDQIIVLGQYLGRKNRILVKCKECGYEWQPIANNLLVGKGCPKWREHNRTR